MLEVNLWFSCQFSPLSFLLPQAHLLHLTTVVCSFLALPRVLFIDVTPSEEMQEWQIYSGWFVTLVSGLVPTWVHKLADLCTNPIGKLFSARDRTPEVTVTSPPLSPAQLQQIREAVQLGVQEGNKPLVRSVAGIEALLRETRDGLNQLQQQGFTYTTTSTVYLAAPPQPSQNNG